MAALRGLCRHASRPFWCGVAWSPSARFATVLVRASLNPSAVLSQYVSRVLVGFEYKDSSIRLAFPWLPLFPPLAYIVIAPPVPSARATLPTLTCLSAPVDNPARTVVSTASGRPLPCDWIYMVRVGLLGTLNPRAHAPRKSEMTVAKRPWMQ